MKTTTLVLDEIDCKIFFRLMKKSKEFSKLDEVDKKLLAWVTLNWPKRIESWLEFLSIDYPRNKSVKIDSAKLLDEVMELM